MSPAAELPAKQPRGAAMPAETNRTDAEGVGAHAGEVYIASKTVHAARWRALRAKGYRIISTWIDEAGVGETACFTDLWRRCVSEAGRAKAVVVYREPGEVLKGAFVEVGAALAMSRPVFAVGCDEFSFVHHALVTRCADIDDAFARALATPAPTAPVAVPDDVRRALENIAKQKTWDECWQSQPQIRETKADISNRLDAVILEARTLLSAPSATRPEAGEDHQPALIRMLSADHARMRKAGTALAEAALYSVREYDGLHRLSLAVAEWSKAVADEGGRAERFSPPPVSVSAPTEEGTRIFADQQSREFVEACDQAEATALSPDTDTAGREGWQPIETAPKDGTPVLIAWLTGNPGESVRRPAVDKAWWAGGWCPDQRVPTHWQPLPAPPVRPSKAEG